MKLTAPRIWIMTSGIYDVLQIWDQDGFVSYFDIYANGVKVSTLEKDDDISYITIEDLKLEDNCNPSHGYNIGVIGYDSDGNSTEDSNMVCWYSDGEYDNNGTDPDFIAPLKGMASISLYLDGKRHGYIQRIYDRALTEDDSRVDTELTAVRNSYNNGVTLEFSGLRRYFAHYDYKTPINETITVSETSLTSSTSYWYIDVYATSSNIRRFKFHRHTRGDDIVNSAFKVRSYGDLTPPIDCIAFVSDTEDFVLSAHHHWDGTVEYSTDRISWHIWDGSAIISRSQKLYLRGYNNTTFCSSTDNRGCFFSLSSAVKCYGNINTLLQYDNPPTTLLSKRCYVDMFYGCTGLTQAPELPATNLAEYCYSSMFNGCTGLTQAPELPATNLAECCYDSMFEGCTGLTQAPELPATNLAEYCYNSMFNGCTGLTQAPELPATNLAECCYDSMFEGCTGLTQAPELPATNLAEYCYHLMFDGCTGLIQAPELPATNLAEYCYNSMFYGCTGLTQAPELPATNLAEYCYFKMFYGCTGLTQAPELPATNLAKYCYYLMFYGCTNLVSIPKLQFTEIYAGSCRQMFARCSKIKLSETQSSTYTQPYRLPMSGNGRRYDYSDVTDMFTRTGGTFTGTPSINTTYYLDESNTIV